MGEYCNDHSKMEAMVTRNENDIKSIREIDVISIWKEINEMKKWVIAGMGSLLIQFAIVIVGVVIYLNR